MNVLTITFCFFICVYESSAVDIMPELKRNILNFGYGINFKYKAMLSHSFDRFFVVAKFELPKLEYKCKSDYICAKTVFKCCD